jgi:hypothetical protein
MPKGSIRSEARCKVIEDFYQCSKRKIKEILELTITAPFGNPGVRAESTFDWEKWLESLTVKV